MILAAGLTPAWQRFLVFDSLRPGAVNRARRVLEGAGGKSVNLAAALRAMGAPVRLLAPAGGERGARFRRHCGEAGLDARFVETASETRICTTLLEEGRATELVENMGPVRPEEIEAFAAAFREEAAGARVVALSGSLPEGTPATFYRDLAAGARATLLVDARGPELLEVLSGRPFLVKPNRRELAGTLGRELQDEQALQGAMGELNERGAEWVVVTEGKGPVRVRRAGRSWTLRPPEVPVVNPIGCGDSMMGGIALGIHEGRDPVEAVRYGIAAAADKLGRILPSQIDPLRVARLAEEVRDL